VSCEGARMHPFAVAHTTANHQRTGWRASAPGATLSSRGGRRRAGQPKEEP
jgi:hypothetical protein